jgi:hypothetical protein
VRTDLVGKTDPEHPHTIDIQKPDELLALLRKAAPASETDAPKPASGQQAAN